jgi:phosphohistidine phosphatase
MGLVENGIIIDRTIYGAGTQQLLELVQNQDDLYKSIMLFGHNPTFTSFVNLLTDSNIMNVVTCGVVRIDFKFSSWIDIDFGSGRLAYYEYPKKYANS